VAKTLRQRRWRAQEMPAPFAVAFNLARLEEDA
jgi:hypothetical protein